MSLLLDALRRASAARADADGEPFTVPRRDSPAPARQPPEEAEPAVTAPGEPPSSDGLALVPPDPAHAAEPGAPSDSPVAPESRAGADPEPRSPEPPRATADALLRARPSATRGIGAKGALLALGGVIAAGALAAGGWLYYRQTRIEVADTLTRYQPRTPRGAAPGDVPNGSATTRAGLKPAPTPDPVDHAARSGAGIKSGADTAVAPASSEIRSETSTKTADATPAAHPTDPTEPVGAGFKPALANAAPDPRPPAARDDATRPAEAGTGAQTAVVPVPSEIRSETPTKAAVDAAAPPTHSTDHADPVGAGFKPARTPANAATDHHPSAAPKDATGPAKTKTKTAAEAATAPDPSDDSSGVRSETLITAETADAASVTHPTDPTEPVGAGFKPARAPAPGNGAANAPDRHLPPAPNDAANAPIEPAAPAPRPARPLVQVARTAPLAEALHLGYRALRAGDLTTAAAAYRRARTLAPDNRDALLGAAAVHQRLGEPTAARRLYERVLAAWPRDPYARAALVALDGPQPRRDQTELKLLLRDAPDSPTLNFALGNLYAAESRWARARAVYARAAKAAPTDPDYAYNLAVALDHLGQRDAARRAYARALRLAASAASDFRPDAARRRLRQLR